MVQWVLYNSFLEKGGENQQDNLPRCPVKPTPVFPALPNEKTFDPWGLAAELQTSIKSSGHKTALHTTHFWAWQARARYCDTP